MLSKFKNFSKQQRGISLLEVMLSLAIIAIILVMATRYFSLASGGNRINEAISQINEIKQAEYRYFGANHTYTSTLADLDPYLTPGTVSAKNAWGGDVTLGGGTGSSVQVTLNGITSKDCNALAAQLGLGPGACSGGSVSVNVVD